MYIIGEAAADPHFCHIVAGAHTQCLVPDPVRADLVSWAFERFPLAYTHASRCYMKSPSEGCVLGREIGSAHKRSSRRYGNPFMQPHRCVGINVQGRHQAIVSDEVFDKVQMILNGQRPTVTRARATMRIFPLRHFVRCGECGDPLTGSWSTGRGKKRYAYYHCQDGCTRVSKENFEAEFVDLLKKLQPHPQNVALFRKVVLDVLRTKQGDAIEPEAALERKLRELRSNRDKLEDAFIYQKAIDLETYQRMRTALLSDITLAQIKELREASLEAIDAEEVIEFALEVLVNASNLWKTSSLDQKQRFQQVLFPEGVEYIDGDYRTTATCMLFNGLEADEVEKEELVALPGIEPGLKIGVRIRKRPLKLLFCKLLKYKHFAFAERRAGFIMDTANLWLITGINGCSGHKIATWIPTRLFPGDRKTSRQEPSQDVTLYRNQP